jgi:hypothetical protein
MPTFDSLRGINPISLYWGLAFYMPPAMSELVIDGRWPVYGAVAGVIIETLASGEWLDHRFRFRRCALPFVNMISRLAELGMRNP